MNRLKPSLIPGIIWFIISTILFTLPGSSLPQEDWLDKIWFDKWVHIGLFCVMVFLFGWGILKKIDDPKKTKRGFVSLALVCFAYGIMIEFVQDNFIPNRSFDYGDIIADFVGCFAGYWLIIKIAARYIKK